MSMGFSRIVSLLPSTTEMVSLLGAENKLVGISHECDFPESISGLPRVTKTALSSGKSSGEINEEVGKLLNEGQSLYSLDEKILLSLKPDLILTQKQCDVCAIDVKTVERWVFQNCPATKVWTAGASHLEGIFQEIQDLGGILGAESLAQQWVEEAQERLSDLKNSWKRPIRILFLEWLDPLMPAGSWTPELLARSGIDLVLKPPGEKTISFPMTKFLEAAIGADVLVLCPCGFSEPQTFAEWEKLKQTPGYDQLAKLPVIIIDGNQYFNRGGPRLIDSVEILIEKLRKVLLYDTRPTPN